MTSEVHMGCVRLHNLWRDLRSVLHGCQDMKFLTWDP